MGKALHARFLPVQVHEGYTLVVPGACICGLYLNGFIEELEGARITQTKDKMFLEVAVSNRDQAVEILWRIKKSLEAIE